MSLIFDSFKKQKQKQIFGICIAVYSNYNPLKQWRNTFREEGDGE